MNFDYDVEQFDDVEIQYWFNKLAPKKLKEKTKVIKEKKRSDYNEAMERFVE